MVYRHVQVGDGLCLHSLCGIHHQQCTLAGGYGARHLVGEVHMSRSVYQIEYVFLAV